MSDGILGGYVQRNKTVEMITFAGTIDFENVNSAFYVDAYTQNLLTNEDRMAGRIMRAKSVTINMDIQP